MFEKLKDFYKNWSAGFRFLMYVVVLGGLCLFVGALTGFLIFSLVVAAFHFNVPTSYGIDAAGWARRFWASR